MVGGLRKGMFFIMINNKRWALAFTTILILEKETILMN